jgi:site-specific DNA recombinase
LIEIRLTGASVLETGARILTVPWTAPSPYRRREIIQGQGDQNLSIRPMRVKARVAFVEALRLAHCWLDELVTDPRLIVEAIAAREGKTERSIRMTLSLTFLAPPIVKAAIDGRLPRVERVPETKGKADDIHDLFLERRC